MGKSLVALDTDHIKGYVFGTNKLKEIRGASSLLDYLNRIGMKEAAESLVPFETFDDRYIIYANGGSGLFLVDDEKKAERFGEMMQKTFREVTGSGASITYIVQELPEDVPNDIDSILDYPLLNTLALMRYRLREAKGCPPDVIALPSHPFMHPCDACGVEYADGDEKNKADVREIGEENAQYCASCLEKRRRDIRVKGLITRIEEGQHTPYEEYLWDKVITCLREKKYDLPPLTERPHDFNVFRNFKGAKDYIGLIYADANGMGKQVEACETLAELQKLAADVDEAIYEAVCIAITKHLKIEDHMKPQGDLTDDFQHPVFPFDILLLGGDDVLMVTPASVVMDVAFTIAKEFHRLTKEKDPKGEGVTLSVGVLLAPVNYPFGLQWKLVDDTLKFAKKEDAKKQTAVKTDYGDTRINFMTVTGSTSHSFEKVYELLCAKGVRVSGHTEDVDFYATLRPYNLEQLAFLLEAIRRGRKLGLGRTKLHQVREAVLKKNLTTSVVEGLAVLRNWKDKQRTFVVKQVYEFGGRYQVQYSDSQNPASMFPRVTFPWFADGEEMYRTSLLDFVELYDFVAREEDEDGDEG